MSIILLPNLWKEVIQKAVYRKNSSSMTYHSFREEIVTKSICKNISQMWL